MSRWARLLLVGSMLMISACVESQQAQDVRTTRNPGASRPQSLTRDNVTVQQKPVDVKRRTFDPNNKPSDMPPLSPPEAAVTTSSFSVGARVLVQVLDDRRRDGQVVSEVKVDNVNVELGLGIVVWLPIGASPALREHEEGHRRISEIFYDGADQIALEIARPYVGRTFKGTGKDAQAARDAAMRTIITEINQKFMAAVQGPSSRANEEYDRLTDHGRNKTPVNRAIEEAVSRTRTS